MKKILLTLPAFLWVLSIQAETYYLSGEGDNDADGSIDGPWRTLQVAAAVVQAGDSIIVLAGNYEGFCMGWNNETEGTPSDPIVFKALPGANITSKNLFTDDGINLEGVSYIVIEGFTITNDGSIARAGIRSVENTGVVIRNNTIDGMGTWGIFTGFSYNILIENNHCSNSIDEHGIYFSNSGDNPVIRGNTSYSNNGCGIHMNGDASMGDDGIISNALVEANIIYDNGADGGSGINCDGVQNSVIRNNLLYNNHSSGISLYMIDGAEGAKNNKIINNTIVMPDDGRWALNINSGSTGNTILNNIFFSNHSFRGGLVVDESSMTNIVSDYNVSINRFSPDGDETIMNIDEWREETGQDMHSYISTPADLFVGSTDFHLKEGVIAIDHGTATHAPATDIESGSRPAGNGYDIGAYEFGAVVNYINHTEGQLLVYPNPVTSECNILATEPIKSIRIIDLEGKTIQTANGNGSQSLRIDVTNLHRGIFILQIDCGTIYQAKIRK